MTYLRCDGCGGFALALTRDGARERPVCMGCLDSKEPEGATRRYVCSIVGCENQPAFLGTMDDEGQGSLLVCERHFNDVKGSLRSYLEVPRWLTNESDFDIDEGGIVFEFDIDGNGD